MSAYRHYPADQARQAIEILDDLGAPCLIHQPKYSMFERAPEQEASCQYCGKRGQLYSVLSAGRGATEGPLSE